jgi:hypothetical protein
VPESSELSKIYGQYHDSLTSAQQEYDKSLKEHARALRAIYDELIKEFTYGFGDLFGAQVERLELKRYCEDFFRSAEIPFVAIDGSCHKNPSANFISFYGGAYGSKGTISLSGAEGKLKYDRWELNRDVSMVAFVPLPPETIAVPETTENSEDNESPSVLTDSEVAEFSSYHTKIMQLAEIYLAHSLAASSSVDTPRLILIDNNISGILANTSFSPFNLRVVDGTFDGESLTQADCQVALAHPLSKELGVPSSKKFQPHFRVIAEAAWAGRQTISASDCQGFSSSNFDIACRFLQNRVQAGTYDQVNKTFTFFEDPRASWQKANRVYEGVCERLFRAKDPKGLTYSLRTQPSSKQYLTPRDIVFLTGVGIRALIETCWKRRIMLIGIAKDSSSRFFYRNFLGVTSVQRGQDVKKHLSIPLTDRTIVEMLPNLDTSLRAPWGTLEFDSCFMTIHPQLDEKTGTWKINGYELPIGEVTRPERLFLRSLVQFFLTPDGRLSSHALFIDRLAHPGWDDSDSSPFSLDTDFFGEINPLYYEKRQPSRLQKLSVYLLSVLVRNHYPDALGYPDPLHQADWGAKSMERRIVSLLDSSEWAYRSRPREKTFRAIRDEFGR